MKKAGVVMLSSTFAPLIGGTETQALQLTRTLIRAGTPAFVVTQKKPGVLPAFEILSEVPIVRLPAWNTLLFVFNAFLYLLWNKNRFQVLHAHMAAGPAVAAAAVGTLLQKPSLVKIAGGGRFGEWNAAQGRRVKMLKWAFLKRFVRMFVCPSEDAKAELLQAGIPAEKLRKIPNGVDTEFFQPASPSEKSEWRKSRGWGNETTVLYVGRLEEEKGTHILLEAWSSLPKDCRLVLVGDGRWRDRVKETLARHPNIRWEGTSSDVRSYLRAADVFVMPSLSEGLPNSLLEAMSCGLPSVASWTGGIKDLLREGREGLTVAPGDPQALRSALLKACQDKTWREGAASAARERILESFSLSRVADQYRSLYQELL